MKAVILAAGIGSRLHPLTADRPKALVEVGGVPLLFRAMDRLAQAGIGDRDVIIVGGYREDVLRARLAQSGRKPTVIFNPKFDTWNNFYSLLVAQPAVGADSFLQLDGDVLFDDQVVPRVLAAAGPAVLAVEVRPEPDAEAMKVEATGADHRIRAISKKLDPKSSLGEFIGLSRIDASVAGKVWAELAALEREGLTNEYYEFAYNRLVARNEVAFHGVDVADCSVTEIDDVKDLAVAEELAKRVA